MRVYYNYYMLCCIKIVIGDSDMAERQPTKVSADVYIDYQW